MNAAEKRVITAAKAFCKGAEAVVSLDAMSSKVIHELYDSVKNLDARKNKLIIDIRHLIAGTELTEDEGNALIDEVRIRMRGD